MILTVYRPDFWEKISIFILCHFKLCTIRLDTTNCFYYMLLVNITAASGFTDIGRNYRLVPEYYLALASIFAMMKTGS